eukprot:PhF_6_TR7293/c0_g1_i1/m.10904/K00784/rnz; ribonuclease Z
MITCLGTDTPDCPPAFLVATQEHSYLINCPEGTQRYCVERHHRICTQGRLLVVCLTEINSKYISGLPGLFLTISDVAQTPQELIILCPDDSMSEIIRSWWESLTFCLHNVPRLVKVVFRSGTYTTKDITLTFSSSSSRLFVIFPEKPGAFLPDAAKELGVRKGPKWAKLKNGHSVSSDECDNAVVHPHQVMLGGIPPQIISVAWSSETDERDHQAVLVISFHGIVPCEAKLQWHRSHDVMVMPTFPFSHLVHLLLNIADPNAFLIKGTHNAGPGGNTSCVNWQPELKYIIHQSKLTPKGILQPEALDYHEIIQSCPLLPKLREFRELNHPAIHAAQGPPPPQGPIFGVLGTGCAIPSVFRNVTGNIILHDELVIFVDCGEGTIGQLNRIMDVEVAMFGKKVFILITHAHADHNLGVWSLLACVGMYATECTVFYPESMTDHFRICSNEVFTGMTRSGCSVQYRSLPSRGGKFIEWGSCLRVVHPADAFGFVIELGDKYRIVFSGDTRPCESVVTAGITAPTTLLVHEATFHNNDQLDAVSKEHSTVAEAVSVHVAMKSENCLLTHISQKYPRQLQEYVSCCSDPTVHYAVDLVVFPVRTPPPLLKSRLLVDCVNWVLEKLHGPTKDDDKHSQSST